LQRDRPDRRAGARGGLSNNATLTTLDLRDNNIGDEGAHALAAALGDNATLTALHLSHNNIGAEVARALAAALGNNVKLTQLLLGSNDIGAEGARALAAALANNATLTSLDLAGTNIGDEGARAFAAGLANNATLTSLDLVANNIGAEGARTLAAALANSATLTTLYLFNNNIGAEGARARAAVLDTNRTLQILVLGGDVTADIRNVVADRLRVTRLAPEVAAWVASALARRVELWDDKLVLPPAFAAPPCSRSVASFWIWSVLQGGSWMPPTGGARPTALVRGGLPAAARLGRAASRAAASGRRRQKAQAP
jgi:hypothetical protein